MSTRHDSGSHYENRQRAAGRHGKPDRATGHEHSRPEGSPEEDWLHAAEQLRSRYRTP
jgi:hypothetical protein